MTANCPCIDARDGAFVIGACAYPISEPRVFFGGDFRLILHSFLASPLDLHGAFDIWLVATLVGITLLYSGIRENMRDGHSAPVAVALLAIFGCAMAMHNGWYLVWWHICHAFYWAVIAGSCADLCMAVAARHTSPARHPYRGLLVELERERQRLAGVDQQQKLIAAEHAEMQAVLTFPGVRPALLHLLHSDHHAGLPTAELRQRDEAVAKLTTIYQRIAANGR